jgi:UDP-N-acetylglucosamine/UDP-N-acetylgalactosamine 4-epimerase
MSEFEKLLGELRNESRTWLVTGVAGFIGSNLLEALLKANQQVIGLDNFSTGKRENLAEVLNSVTDQQRKHFRFIDGDIRRLENCQEACKGAQYVLHQAALGSVPRSISDPMTTHQSNATGFLNMLLAARDQGVERFVYASSSSVYGDEATLPKVEGRIGRPLSPYAITKALNELYAGVFHQLYGLQSIGLRYFNVFGPRQDPQGPYAAVIPKWVAAMIKNEPAIINGDGSTSRDFCYVANVVQANMLSATTTNAEAIGEVFNVALNARTSLNELFELIRQNLSATYPHLKEYRGIYQPFRMGDIQHSQADISKAQKLLGYAPTHTMAQGMAETLAWYDKQKA